MDVGRRGFLGFCASVALGLTGLGRRLAFGSQAGPTVALLSASNADAAALRAIMASCVSDETAFYGKCGEWPLSWAQELAASRPDTPVIVRNGVAIAFHELPPIKDSLPALAESASDEDRAKHALRERNRRTFRVTAAGVRDDLLSAEESVTVFREIIYQTYKRALAMGYEYAECFAPWEKHPRLEKKFTDYPGLELVEKVAEGQEGGRSVYWLRWRLEDAIAALEAEGAGDPRLEGV